jgi:hypothetical protein
MTSKEILKLLRLGKRISVSLSKESFDKLQNSLRVMKSREDKLFEGLDTPLDRVRFLCHWKNQVGTFEFVDVTQKSEEQFQIISIE